MAEFKKLINPPIKASEINSESATNGQVLTANGTGGATWQNPTGGGTEVVANPVLAGTESDLTGLEVAGTKYKVPTGGSGGGTQLYMHSIEGYDSDERSILVNLVTTSESELTDITDFSAMGDNPIISIGLQQVGLSCGLCTFDGQALYMAYVGAANNTIMYSVLTTIITDTVTPL